MYSLLNKALTSLEGAQVDAQSVNAACWLLQNGSQLFGPLAETLPRLLAAAGLPSSIPQGFTVDAQAARKFLAPALEPTVASLVRLFRTTNWPG